MTIELNLLDKHRVEASRIAEAKCRKLKNGAVPRSPLLQQAINRIRYCRLCIRTYKYGRKHKSRTLTKAFQRQTGPIIKSAEVAVIQLKDAFLEYYRLKPHAAVTRHKFLDDLANAQSAATGKDAAGIYNQLKHREEQRRVGARVRSIKQKSRSYVTEVMALGDDGTLQKFHTKADVETKLCQESIRRFSQANHTLCMQPDQVSLLGTLAESDISNQILQGTLLPYLKQPDSVRAAGEIDLSISLETYIKGWKKQKENTSSGGTMHFGHFKASIFNNTLADCDRMFLEICLKTGHTLPRWKRGIDVMIPKKTSSINVTDMRTICLLPADWNFGNKILSRRIMHHAETCKSIAPEQYGSRKGKSAIQHATNKALLFDLQRQQKHDAALLVLDAKACYDRIPHHIAALCLRRQGLPASAIRFMFNPISQMRHTIQTGYGEVTISYNARDHRLHGILQGNGAGPCIWVMVSSPLLDHLRHTGLGIERLDPTTGNITTTPAITFVDDNDIVVSLKPYFSSPDVHSVFNRRLPLDLTRPQTALTSWTEGLDTAAGATLGLKSNWQLLSHHYSAQDRWSFNKVTHTPGQLHVLEGDQLITIQRKEYNEATLALGIMFSVDGSMKDQIGHLKAKVREWCDAIRVRKLSKYENWYALNRCILRTLHYPLRATTLSQDEITSVLAPLLETMLSRSGICRKMYRDAIYSDYKHLGFGLPNLWDEQGLLKLLDFLGADNPSDTTNLIHESLRHLQLEAGLGPHFLNQPFTPSLKAICTPGILTTLWEFCSQAGIQLIRNVAQPKHTIDDFYIMEKWLSLTPSLSTLKDLQACRFFLQIELTSEMLYLTGTGIRPHIWKGNKFQDNNWRPIQPRPSERAWKTWRYWLSEVFPVTEDGAFSIPRPVNSFGYDQWRWFMSKSEDQVYELTQSSRYRLYERLPDQSRRTRQSLEYVFNGSYVTSLPDSVFAVTTIFLATDHIIVDSKTNAPPLIHSNLSLLAWTSSIQTETIGSAAVLKQEALAGQLVLISDGSYKGPYATGAFIITSLRYSNQHYIQGSTRTTGPGHIQDSYRAELTGILAGLHHVQHLLQAWDIDNHGGIPLVLGCDNLSALEVSFDKFFHPSIHSQYNHFDVIQSIRASIQHNLWITLKHIKGHQDDLDIILNPEEELNVRMDTLCKKVRRRLEADNSTTNWNAALSFWKWRIHLGTENVCTQLLATIKEHLSEIRMEQVSTDLKLLPPDIFSLVNWDAVGQAMDTIKPSHKRWVAKHNVGMCGVNKWRHVWGYHHSPLCLQCKETETTQHIYLCKHQSVQTAWDLELIALDQWLDDANTAPDLHEAMLAGLRSLRDPQVHPDSSDISSKQQLIGWIQFFEGNLHLDWSKQQQQYLLDTNSRRSGQRWCSNLIGELWAMRKRLWQQRNDRVHEKDKDQQLQDLAAQLLDIIEKGFNTIPRRNRNLHTPAAIRKVVASTDPEYKRSWIRNITAAKAFWASAMARQAGKSQSTLHSFFPSAQS